MNDELLQLGFKRIERQDIAGLKKYYYLMKSDYASSIDLLSIFSWNKNLPIYYKIVYNYLLCVVYDKINNRWVCLPPIGDYEKEETEKVFSLIESIFTHIGCPLVFTDVSEWMVSYFHDFFKDRLEILDMDELKEYIYSMDDFKHKLEQQQRRYDYKYFINKNHIVTKNLTMEMEKDCLMILEESFCQIHPCEECEYGCLKDTLHNALWSLEEGEGSGFIIYDLATPIAYNIVSREKDQLVFHFKKNKRGFRGINEYIHKETIERFGIGCTSMNYTEDMGVEGLRKYKSNLCSFTLQSKLELRIKGRNN